MARKTTNKSGSKGSGSRRASPATGRKADVTTPPSDAATTPEDAASDSLQDSVPEEAGSAPVTTDGAPDPADSEVAGQSDDTETPSQAQPETAAIDPPAELADGPAQMGDDTVPDGAPDTPAEGRNAALPAAAQDTASAAAQDDRAAAPAAADAGGSVAPPRDRGAGAAQHDTPAPTRRGGFVPLVLGGVIAAGLGYFANELQSPPPPAADPDTVAALQDEVATLRAALAARPDIAPLAARVAELEARAQPDPVDLAPLRDEVAQLRAALGAVAGADEQLQADIAALRAEIPDMPDLAPLRARLDAVETATAPLDDRLATLESRLANTADRLDTLAADTAGLPDRMDGLRSDMAALRELATDRVAQAESSVDTARARAGLDRVRAALVSGAPYADAVAQMTDAGVDVPDAVVAPADDGVRTIEDLQDGFDPAARAAVSASLQAAPADSAAEKLGNFLRAQVGARALAPREGDAPDAIVARAGAALDAGDLQTALDELGALPDDGRAAMADWITAAQARRDAQAALDPLARAITTE